MSYPRGVTTLKDKLAEHLEIWKGLQQLFTIQCPDCKGRSHNYQFIRYSKEAIDAYLCKVCLMKAKEAIRYTPAKNNGEIKKHFVSNELQRHLASGNYKADQFLCAMHLIGIMLEITTEEVLYHKEGHSENLVLSDSVAKHDKETTPLLSSSISETPLGSKPGYRCDDFPGSSNARRHLIQLIQFIPLADDAKLKFYKESLTDETKQKIKYIFSGAYNNAIDPKKLFDRIHREFFVTITEEPTPLASEAGMMAKAYNYIRPQKQKKLTLITAPVIDNISGKTVQFSLPPTQGHINSVKRLDLFFLRFYLIFMQCRLVLQLGMPHDEVSSSLLDLSSSANSLITQQPEASSSSDSSSLLVTQQPKPQEITERIDTAIRAKLADINPLLEQSHDYNSCWNQVKLHCMSLPCVSYPLTWGEFKNCVYRDPFSSGEYFKRFCCGCFQTQLGESYLNEERYCSFIAELISCVGLVTGLALTVGGGLVGWITFAATGPAVAIAALAVMLAWILFRIGCFAICTRCRENHRTHLVHYGARIEGKVGKLPLYVYDETFNEYTSERLTTLLLNNLQLLDNASTT
jgi:hypothetical protein